MASPKRKDVHPYFRSTSQRLDETDEFETIDEMVEMEDRERQLAQSKLDYFPGDTGPGSTPTGKNALSPAALQRREAVLEEQRGRPSGVDAYVDEMAPWKDLGASARRLQKTAEEEERRGTYLGAFTVGAESTFKMGLAGWQRLYSHELADETMRGDHEKYRASSREKEDVQRVMRAGGRKAAKDYAGRLTEAQKEQSGFDVQVAGGFGNVLTLVGSTMASGPLAPLTSIGLISGMSVEGMFQTFEQRAVAKFLKDTGKLPTEEERAEMRDRAWKAGLTYGLPAAVVEVAAERLLTKPGALLLKRSLGSTFRDILATSAVKTAGEGFSGASTELLTNWMVQNEIDPDQKLTEGLMHAFLLESIVTSPIAGLTTARGGGRGTFQTEALIKEINNFKEGVHSELTDTFKERLKEAEEFTRTLRQKLQEDAAKGDLDAAKFLKEMDEQAERQTVGTEHGVFAVSQGTIPKDGGLPVDLVTEVVQANARGQASGLPEVEVVQSVFKDGVWVGPDWVPEPVRGVMETQRKSGQGQRGVLISYFDESGKERQKVLMVADYIPTTDIAAQTYHHEVVGHAATDLMMGDLGRYFYLEVGNRWSDSTLGRKIYNAYKETWEAEGLTNEEMGVRLGEEIVANVSESGDHAPPTLVKAMVDFFRQGKPDVPVRDGPAGDKQILKALSLASTLRASDPVVKAMQNRKRGVTARAVGDEDDAKFALDPDLLVDTGMTVAEHLEENRNKAEAELIAARDATSKLAKKHGIFIPSLKVDEATPEQVEAYLRVRGAMASGVSRDQAIVDQLEGDQDLLRKFGDAEAKVRDWQLNVEQAGEIAGPFPSASNLGISERTFEDHPVDSRTLKLMEGGSTVGEALDSMEKNTSSGAGRLMAKEINALIRDPEDRRVPISSSPKEATWDPATAGEYVSDRIGPVSPDLSNVVIYQAGGPGNWGRTVETVLHEIVHAATAKNLDRYLDVDNRAKALAKAPAAIRNIYDLFQDAQKIMSGASPLGDVHQWTGITKDSMQRNPDTGELYAMSDVHEFVAAAFTDPQFMEMLKRIPMSGKAGTLKSMAKGIMDAIAWILGGRDASRKGIEHTYLAHVIEAGSQLLALQRPTQEQLASEGALRTGDAWWGAALQGDPFSTEKEFLKAHYKGMGLQPGAKAVFKKQGVKFSLVTTEMADGSTLAVDHNHERWSIKPIPEHFKQEGYIYENIDLPPVQKRMMPDAGQRIAKSMNEAVLMIERLSVQSPKFSLPLNLTEAELENLVNEIKDPKHAEGFTMDLRTVFAQGGFAVAPRKETEFVVAQTAFDVETMRTYLTKFANDFEREGAHLGGWLDEESGEFMLDVVFPLPSYEDAVRVSIWGDQDGIYDLKNFETIRTKYKNGNTKVPKGFKENRAAIQARKPVDSIANAKAAEASYRKSGGVRGKGVSPVGGFLHAQAKYSLAQESHGLGFLKGTEVVRDLPSRPTIIQIAKYFQKVFGKAIDFSKPKEGDNARVEEAIYREVLFGLTLQPNAAGWYDQNLGAAMSILKLMDPDISKLENDFIFKAVLAITSDGNRVQGQFDQTWETYQNWKESGELTADATSGTRIPTIHANIGKLNRVINALADSAPIESYLYNIKEEDLTQEEALETEMIGPDEVIANRRQRAGMTRAAQWLTRKGTVKEIRAAAVKDLGFSKGEAKDLLSSELIDEVVPYASIFGPKIGSFFNNLYGDYSTVTMDRWFMRTLGRNTGTQVKPPTPAQWRESKTRMREAVAALSKEEAKYLRISSNQATGNKALELAKRLHRYFALESNRKAVEMTGMGEGWVKDASGMRMDEVRLAANHLHGLSSPLVEAPRSGRHRRWIRQRIAGVQARLIADGKKLENAELPAVLWYVEKELYNALGYNTRTAIDPTTGEVVEDTPDYASAAEQLHQRIEGGPSGVAGTGGAIGKATPGVGGGKFSLAPSKRRLDDDTPLRHQWLPVAQPGSTRDAGEYQRQVIRQEGERAKLLEGLEAEGRLPDDILTERFPHSRFSLGDDPETGESKWINRLKADESLPDTVRERLEAAYVVQGHQEVQDRAVVWLSQYETYDLAAVAINTDDFWNGKKDPWLDTTDRAMIGMRVLKAMSLWGEHVRVKESNPDVADTYDDLSIELANRLGEHGRLAGRTVSVMQEWGQLNPFALQTLVKRSLNAATQHKLKKKGGKGLAEAINPILAAVKAAGLGTLETEEFKKHLEKLYNDGDLSLWGRYKQSAADRISASIEKWLVNEPGESVKKTALATFTDQLVAEMKRRMKLEGKKVPNQITDWFPILKDALENGEKYAEVWTKVGETLQDMVDKGKLSPAEMGHIEEELGDMLTDPSGHILESTVEQQMKALNIKLSEIVQEHYSERDATSHKLTETIMKRLDLKPTQANRIAILITNTINRKMKEETKKQLDSLLAQFNKPKQKRVIKSMADRIIPLVNLGALDMEDTYEAVAKIMGVQGAYDERFANKVKKLTDRIQKAPEGFQKNSATLDLMNAIANQAGDGIVRMALNIRIANLLSAPGTHSINITANAMVGSLMLMTQMMRAKGNPNVIVPMLTSMLEGVKKGGREAKSIFKTGRGRAGFELSKFMPDPYLERKTFKGGKLNPFNYWKYVMRAMAMMDVLFRFTNIEAKAAFLAGMEADGKGYKGKAKRDYIKEALAYTEEFEKAAVSQAESERSLGYLDNDNDFKRRVDELIESNRSEDVTEGSNAYGYLSTFQNRPEGIVGHLANWMGQAAHPGRKPGEVITKSQAIVSFGAQWFVPFIRVVANVLNMTLDFTPGLGYARAKLHQTNLYHQVHKTARDKTDDEIQDMYARNLLGQVFAILGAYLFFGDDDEEEPKWDITGSGPRGWQQQQTWKNDHNAPYQIIVGGKKFGYKEWPISGMLAFRGGMNDARKFDGDNFTSPNMYKRGAMTLLRLTYDQNFLKGIRDIHDMFSGEEQHAGAIERNLKSGAKTFIVPNLLNHIDRAFDTTKYTENDVDQWLVQMTPFARATGHPTLTVWGEPAHYTPDEGFAALFDRVMSDYKPDPLLDKLIKHKIIPVKPNKNTVIRKNDDVLSDTHRAQDLYVYQWYRGKQMRHHVSKFSDQWSNMDNIRAHDKYGTMLNLSNKYARAKVNRMDRREVLETMAKIKKTAKQE